MKMHGNGPLVTLAIVMVITFSVIYSNDYLAFRNHKPAFLKGNNDVQHSYDTSNTILKKRLDQLSLSLTDMWCQFKHLTYTGGFCLTADEVYMGGNHMWDLGLCKSIEDLVGRSSIVDLGAGLGPYGRCFLRRKEPVFTLSTTSKTEKVNSEFLNAIGDYINTPQKVYSWDGCDGAGGVERLSKGFVKQRDLTEEGLWLGRRFDWVISLEVGEHIPAAYEKIYMDNLFKHSCKGIVMSWAGPKQGGHHHVNGHTLAYVNEKMSAYGMYPDEQAELVLREKSNLSWFKHNLLVFRHNHPKNCTL